MMMEYFHSTSLLLTLIIFFSTTLASASNSWVSPRLSVLPPKWLVQRGGDDPNLAPNISSYISECTLYEYDQTIDHFTFRPKSYTKFKQRYVINPKHWGGAKSKSPIFVYLGPESDIEQQVPAIGLVHENAPKFKAMIVFIEHRFFGKSFPYGWKPEEAIKHEEIRGCLSTSQVLADYAEIISYLKRKYSADLSPVVVFGASYGGMLATWFRLKYPHIAMGALASSGPVLYHVGSYNKYNDRVAKDYWDTSKSCYMTIKQGFEEIGRLASQPKGLANLSDMFNLCSTAKNVSDIYLLLENIFKNAAQYDNPPTYKVEAACKAIDATPKNASILDKLGAGIGALAGSATTTATSNSDDCTDLDSIRNGEGDMISYNWESCMELVHEQGVGKNSLFPEQTFSVTGYAKDCARKYRVPSRAPYWMNQNYGGKHIKLDLRRFGSNIIFTNGNRDPWAPSGVLENISDTIVALNHPGAHCYDVQFSAETDPQWITDLRNKEMSIIKGWLSTYNADLRALKMD